eukprot:15591537-Heterocapsa_arctica.AAC.1
MTGRRVFHTSSSIITQLDKRPSERAERGKEEGGQLFHGARASANGRRSSAARKPPVAPA